MEGNVMGYLLMFLIHCIMFVGVVITVLFINQYSSILSIGFVVLYIIAVKLFFNELENQ